MKNFSPAAILTLGSSVLMACSPLTGVDTSKYEKNYVHNPDKISCKRVIKTGTRLTSKMCKTNYAWAQQARDAQESTTDIQRKATQGSSPQGG